MHARTRERAKLGLQRRSQRLNTCTYLIHMHSLEDHRGCTWHAPCACALRACRTQHAHMLQPPPSFLHLNICAELKMLHTAHSLGVLWLLSHPAHPLASLCLPSLHKLCARLAHSLGVHGPPGWRTPCVGHLAARSQVPIKCSPLAARAREAATWPAQTKHCGRARGWVASHGMRGACTFCHQCNMQAAATARQDKTGGGRQDMLTPIPKQVGRCGYWAWDVQLMGRLAAIT